VKSLIGRDHLAGLGTDYSIILKWILKIGCKGVEWTGFIWLKIGTDGGSGEDGNKPWGSTECS
jgi:hypothetical protein